MTIEAAISDFDITYRYRSDNFVLCAWAQNSWVDLRGQMDKSMDGYLNSGKASIVPFLEKGSIILEEFWNGFATVVDITGPESYDLLFVVPSGRSYKIHINLSQYADYLLQARGIFPWQLLFIEEPVEGLELGCEFYSVMSILSEGQPILSLPQFKLPDPQGSLAELAARLGYYDNFQKHLKSLGGAGFDYAEVKDNPGRGYHFIARVEYDLGRRLPDDIRTWFYLYDEVEVQWRKRRGVAALKFLAIEVVFGGNPDAFSSGVPTPPFNRDAAHYYNDPSAKDLLNGAYPFMIDERGDVVIGFEEDHTVLYLLDSDITTKTRLQVTLPEFIERLCKTRGISGWHTYLVDPSEENLAELRAMVDEVFPGTEL